MKTEFCRLVLSCAAVMALATVAGAQSLQPGDRARIVLRETQRQDETQTQRQLILRGDVASVSGDTVFLRFAGTVGAVGVPLGSAISVHRSLGVRSRPASAVRNGLLLATVGALYLGLTFSETHDYGVVNRGEALALGAGLGAVTGAVIGALLPTERWQRIRR